jgi:hypothetical protein
LTRAASVGDQLTDEQRSGAVAQPADPGAVIPDSSPPESADDRNVFLDAEAAAAGSGGRTVTPASRWSIAALLTRLIGAMTPPQQSVRPHTSSRATQRRMPMMRPNRPVTLALASLAAIAVAAVILTRSGTPSSRTAKASGHGAIASLLDEFTSASLAVAVNPFPAREAVRRTPSAHVRRVRVHRTNTKPQPRRPTRPAAYVASPARVTATVAARETPAPSTTSNTPATTGTSSSTPVSPGSSGSASSGAAATPAAQPTVQRHTAPSTPGQAFGSAGALAPGSSPDG